MPENVSTPIDWDRIKREYLLGTQSLRELASRNGITEGAIRKRAKTYDWPARDKGVRIRARADELVQGHEAAEERARRAAGDAAASSLKTSLSELKDSELIEAAARNVALVRVSHRVDIDRLRQMAVKMVLELHAMSESRETLTAAGRRMVELKAMDTSQAREIERVLSLTSRAGTLGKLTELTRVIVSMEREAYGMAAIPLGKDGEEAGGEDPISVRVVVQAVDASVEPPDVTLPEPEADE